MISNNFSWISQRSGNLSLNGHILILKKQLSKNWYSRWYLINLLGFFFYKKSEIIKKINLLGPHSLYQLFGHLPKHLSPSSMKNPNYNTTPSQNTHISFYSFSSTIINQISIFCPFKSLVYFLMHIYIW